MQEPPRRARRSAPVCAHPMWICPIRIRPGLAESIKGARRLTQSPGKCHLNFHAGWRGTATRRRISCLTARNKTGTLRRRSEVSRNSLPELKLSTTRPQDWPQASGGQRRDRRHARHLLHSRFCRRRDAGPCGHRGKLAPARRAGHRHRPRGALCSGSAGIRCADYVPNAGAPGCCSGHPAPSAPPCDHSPGAASGRSTARCRLTRA